jgi:hypothetical protein
VRRIALGIANLDYCTVLCQPTRLEDSCASSMITVIGAVEGSTARKLLGNVQEKVRPDFVLPRSLLCVPSVLHDTSFRDGHEDVEVKLRTASIVEGFQKCDFDKGDR